MAQHIKSKVPMVSRNLSRRHLLNHLTAFDVHSDRDQQRGRFASHDRVAMCLLRKDFESAMPVRREMLVARNRRRLKLLFGLILVWWLWGRYFV